MTDKLRYARGGPDITPEQRAWALRHPLYMLGDVVMVYVNEGDLYQFGEEVSGEFVKAEPKMCPECHAVGAPDGVTNCDTCYNGFFDQPKTAAQGAAAAGIGVIDLAGSSPPRETP